MMKGKLQVIPTLVVAGFLSIWASDLQGQLIDDVMIQYSLMNITEAKVGGQIKKPHFYRHNIQLEFGKGQTTFGMIFQRATKDAKTVPGVPENGVMLTAGYDFILSKMFRIQASGRFGITSGNNPGQPLYATDTDFRVNVVVFNTDGTVPLFNKPVFPSSYAGVVVNKYGRVQAIAGAGVWWHYFGFYATGYNALNGVADPFNPGSEADRKWANLQNRGMSLELTYEFGNFKLGVKQNLGFKNSGNDFMGSLQYRHFFGGLE